MGGEANELGRGKTNDDLVYNNNNDFSSGKSRDECCCQFNIFLYNMNITSIRIMGIIIITATYVPKKAS